MEHDVFKDIREWVEEQTKIKQEEEIGLFADILMEGFLYQQQQIKEQSSMQPMAETETESDLQ